MAGFSPQRLSGNDTGCPLTALLWLPPGHWAEHMTQEAP